MAFIDVIDEDRAEGPLAAEYRAARARAGKVFNVLKIQGRRPGALRRAVTLYKEVMFGPSGLTRAERELLAVVASQANDCHY